MLPLENEAVNECWLSDQRPLLLRGAQQRRPADDADGQRGRHVARGRLAGRARARGRGAAERGGAARRRGAGTLVSPHATLEELALAARLMRALGSENVDYRLRQLDLRGEGTGARWLGMPVAEIQAHDRILVVGSFLRNDHPLFAHRIRQAAKKRARVLKLSSVDDDWRCLSRPSPSLRPRFCPRRWPRSSSRRPRLPASRCPRRSRTSRRWRPVLRRSRSRTSSPAEPAGDPAGLARRSASAGLAAARAGAGARGADRRDAGLPARSRERVGGYLAGARPGEGGLPAHAMLAEPRRAYMVVHAEAGVRLREPGGGTARVRARGLRRRADA